MFTATKKNEEEFLMCLAKCKPEEIIGLARLMDIKLLNQEKQLRDATEILEDIMDNFEKMNRSQRRNLMKILRPTVEGRKLPAAVKEVNDGSATENN